MTGEHGPIHLGLIGQGIQASRTPRMHEAEAAAQGIALRYALIDTAKAPAPLPALLDRVEAAGYRGVNVTHPFKQAVIAHLDRLSDEARAIGAVNTVVFEGGLRTGYNTDHAGFAAAFRAAFGDAAPGHVLLLGAGGAGAAVAHALLDLGADHLSLFDPAPDRAPQLASELSARVDHDRVSVAQDLEEAVARADGLVNASPVGMADHPGSPVPPALLRPKHWVADVVYFPLETALLKAARACGCRTMSGAGMAVYQAARAFEIFCGVAAEPARMRVTFDGFEAG